MLHSVTRLSPTTAQDRVAAWWCHVFPVLALALILIPIIGENFRRTLWPVVFAVDGLAIALAVITLSLTPILFVFLLTGRRASWIMDMPASTAELPQMLIVIVAFAVFFMAASLLAPKGFREWTAKGNRATGTRSRTWARWARHFRSCCWRWSASLAARRPDAGVCGRRFAGGVDVGGARVQSRRAGAAALISVLVVEHLWHGLQFALSNGALRWRGIRICPAVPRVSIFCSSAFGEAHVTVGRRGLSLPLHFLLIYRGVLYLNPDFAYKGLIPPALPCLAGLVRLVLTVPKESPTRNTLFALFGGVSLFFITFIFPIQYERHWLTIGWALEGAALVWLFRRVPHPGLRLIGVALLVTSFVRLSLNPWVITEYGTDRDADLELVFTHCGIVAVCLMAAARC